MKNKIIIVSLIAMSLVLSACQSVSKKQKVDVECQEPRPEICTRQFKPVCGIYSEGGTKTYSNACTACSDKTVQGFNEDECTQ